MKRIVIVCRGILDGQASVARVALRHAGALARDYEVTLLTDGLDIPPPDGVQFQQIPAHSYSLLRRFAHVPNELSFVRGVRRALKRMPPADLVLTHSHTAAALAAAPLRLPHAVVTHGNIFDRPWGTFDPLITILYRWVEPRACRRADFVIALAPSMVQAALDNGARPENVVLIPNGIDVDAYAEAPPQITSDEPLRLLFIGRLGVEKGVDLLLDACAIAKLRGVLVHLDVVGGGPLADDLRRQADRIRLDDVVTFHGQQPHEALRRFRAAAMAICVPSRSEAHPLVVLEALASGRPILGTTAGGIPWVVNDGVNGVIVEPDANALAAGIERMHRHRAELRAMAGRARASVERFAWDAVGEQLRAVVGERLNGK